MVVIKSNQTHCTNHVQPTVPSNIASGQTPFKMMDNHTIIDADRRPVDVYRVLQYFKCNEHVTNEDTKAEMLHLMVNACNQIAQFNDNPVIAMQGLIQYRLIGPAYTLIPYRSDEHAANQRRRKSRIQFLKNKQ